MVVENRETLRKEMVKIAAGGDEEMEFPSLDMLAKKVDFQESLLKALATG